MNLSFLVTHKAIIHVIQTCIIVTINVTVFEMRGLNRMHEKMRAFAFVCESLINFIIIKSIFVIGLIKYT